MQQAWSLESCAGRTVIGVRDCRLLWNRSCGSERDTALLKSSELGLAGASSETAADTERGGHELLVAVQSISFILRDVELSSFIFLVL